MRLNEIGLSLTGGTSSEVDVREIVPENIILGDETFTEYMVESNNTLGERQVVALSKIAAFCKDPLLRENRQEEIKNQCLHFWQIPNEARKAPKHEPPTVLISRLLGNRQLNLCYAYFMRKCTPPQVQIHLCCRMRLRSSKLIVWKAKSSPYLTGNLLYSAKLSQRSGHSSWGWDGRRSTNSTSPDERILGRSSGPQTLTLHLSFRPVSLLLFIRSPIDSSLSPTRNSHLRRDHPRNARRVSFDEARARSPRYRRAVHRGRGRAPR